MSSPNEYKIWETDYVDGITESWQNKEFVYSGLMIEKPVKGNNIQEDFRGTLEMEALPDEFVKHDWQHLDYESVRGEASLFKVSTRWKQADIDRMRGNSENPIPGTIQEHMNAYKRKKSSIFRDAATSTVSAKYFGQSSFTDQALDSDNQIGTGAAITVANLRTISSILERRYAMQNGEKCYVAISREEKDTLLAIEELINKDYNLGAAPTITGEFGNMVEGCQLVMDLDLNTSGGTRTCFGWVPSAMVYLNQRSPKVRFGELAEYNYVPQAYMSVDEGAMRRRRYGVVSLSTVANYTF